MNKFRFFFSFKFQTQTKEPVDNEIPLTTTKENLKSFIERWEEHPNSPYIFDVNSSLILPIQEVEKNTSSGFSSRGCSPSPCESLSSNTELFQNGVSPDSAITNDIDTDFDAETDAKAQREHVFERPNSSASVDRRSKSKQDYLQSFDRRHSDSNYVINQTSSLEKINLAEEIKKLSERLMVLSSINDELIEFNKRFDENRKPKIASASADANAAAAAAALATATASKRSELLKNMKNASFSCSSTKTEKVTNQLIHSKSLLTEDEMTASSSRVTAKSVVNDLTERLKTLHELPSLFKKDLHETTTFQGSDKISIGKRFQCSSVSQSSSSSTSPCTFGSVPWPITNRRTKFRVNQLSRDVPIGSPDSHQTIFLEEAANTTKDCLLELLDKYNDKKETRICNIRRHQSISVGNGITDNLEYHSMNSINTFFKRNVFQQNGNTVRKIKARLDSKRQ